MGIIVSSHPAHGPALPRCSCGRTPHHSLHVTFYYQVPRYGTSTASPSILRAPHTALQHCNSTPLQMAHITCGSSPPSLLKACDMHSAQQPTHAPAPATPLHPALATACIDGIWAAGGGCGVGDIAASRGCCPIEMCARVIMREVVVEVCDDVVKCMQQNYGQQQQQQQQQQQPYSSASAWKLALPALNTLMRAATDPSSCLNQVWLLQRQVLKSIVHPCLLTIVMHSCLPTGHCRSLRALVHVGDCVPYPLCSCLHFNLLVGATICQHFSRCSLAQAGLPPFAITSGYCA